MNKKIHFSEFTGTGSEDPDHILDLGRLIDDPEGIMQKYWSYASGDLLRPREEALAAVLRAAGCSTEESFSGR